jgi:very-short-patch-repair endonuclease
LCRDDDTERAVDDRVDFLWHELRLVVETDGLRYHRTAAQQSKDRRRDQDLTAAGYTVLRFTYAQVVREAAATRSTLLAAAHRLSSSTDALMPS